MKDSLLDKKLLSQVWRQEPVIPAFWMLRQKHNDFKVSLGYIARPVSKKNSIYLHKHKILNKSLVI
jgi:hypothetical protein